MIFVSNRFSREAISPACWDHGQPQSVQSTVGAWGYIHLNGMSIKIHHGQSEGCKKYMAMGQATNHARKLVDEHANKGT